MRSFFTTISFYLYRLTLLLLGLVGLIAFFLLTTSGLCLMIKIASFFLPGKLQVNGLHGRAISHISINQLIYTHDSMRIELKQFDLNWRLQEVLLLTGSPITLKTTLKAPLSGDLYIDGHAHLHGGNLRATLKAKQGFFIAEINYNALRTMTIQGKFHGQTLQQDIGFNAIKQLNAKGQFHGESLQQLSLNSQIKALYYNNPLTLTITYHNNQLSALTRLGRNQLNLSGQALFPLHLHAKLVDMSLLSPQLAGLKTTVDIDANLHNQQDGQLTLKIHPGKMALTEQNTGSFQGGELNAFLDNKQLKILGNFIIDNDKTLVLSALLPNFKLSAFDSLQQKISGNLHLTVKSFAFLQEMIPTINQVSGQLQADLNASGSIGKPIIAGNLELTKASLALPQQGIALNPIHLSLQSHDDTWTAKGYVTSNGNPIMIQGDGRFSPNIQGLLHVHGDTVEVVNSRSYSIFLSPNLNIEFAPNLLKIRGTVLVPKAEIKPQTFTNTVSLTDDAIFVNDKIPPPNPYHLDSDIQVTMGNHVAIAAQGLKGLLTGGIQLRQLPTKSMVASGELNISDGKYQAYGQDLVIEQGQLLFSNEAIDNPELHVRAIRTFNNVNNSVDTNQLYDFNSDNLKATNGSNKTRVGIEVSGRLNMPKVQLFSIPSTLTQADILSYLLLGKPANQANKSGGQLLLTAVSALNLDSGHGSTQLLSQLKNKLGIDFNLGSNSAYNQKTGQSSEKTAVVLGKALSKRLYLSYNMGLSQTDNNVLTLKYLLNAFFSIQVNGSMAGSGIDLLYTHQKD